VQAEPDDTAMFFKAWEINNDSDKYDAPHWWSQRTITAHMIARPQGQRLYMQPYHEQGLSLHVGEAEVQVAHVAVLRVAVEDHAGDALRNAPATNKVQETS
jgi:hypothetical protein